MLNTFQTELYQRLQNYQLDDPAHEFGFTKHLIKNHGWTEKYAEKAIAEYKKFAFLTVVAKHQIVPSDAVDQVWHAHLLLTQSYWPEFCLQILRKKLHHHPARGGKAERAEFHELYLQTIASYRHYFGTPPVDIWSPPEVRFGKELKMRRVSTVDNWIIPNRLFRQLLPKFSLAAIIVALTYVFLTIDRASAIPLKSIKNNLSLDNSYLYLFSAAIVAFILRCWVSQPYKQAKKPQLNLYEIAYLAGGEKRAVELAIVRLVYLGYLLPNVRYRTFTIAKSSNPKANAIEHQVLDRVRQTPEFVSLKNVSCYETVCLRRKLEQKKLLIKHGLALGIHHACNCAAFLLFVVTFFCMPSGETPNSTIEISVYILILVYFTLAYKRTRWGDRVLKDLKKRDCSFDPIARFALYGESALTGGRLDDLKQIYQVQKEEDTGGCGCGC